MTMTDDIGGRLRLAREQRGLSVDDAARLTRLSTSVLLAIERNDFAQLPAGMYRKAYLRTVAAEVGLDPSEIAADYESLYEPLAGTGATPAVVSTVTDKWVEELPSRRRAIVTLAGFVTLLAGWLVLQPDPVPTVSDTGYGSESPLTPASGNVQSTAAVADLRDDAAPAPMVAAPERSLKIDLATNDWCWVAAESDGERVWYGLMEPGKQLVVRGRHRISLRLGNAGSVQLSVNDGPRRTPGGDGEVVELQVTADDFRAMIDGTVNSES